MQVRQLSAAQHSEASDTGTEEPRSTSWQHVMPDLANVVSAVECGNQPAITDAILWLVLATGVSMKTVSASGNIRGALVCISASRDEVKYLHSARGQPSNSEAWHSIPTAEITGFVQGCCGGGFAGPNWKPQLLEVRKRSFSILYNGYSLGFIAPSTVAFDLWVEGLERMTDIELSVGEDIPDDSAASDD